MTLQEKIKIIDEIGKELKEVLQDENKYSFPGFECINNENSWFTPEFTKKAITHISELLEEKNLNNWLSKYNLKKNDKISKLRLGIVMAGNIPLVGFHDFLCAYFTDADIIVKTSSKDKLLTKWIIERIITKSKNFLNQKIEVTDGFIKNIDAIIATGSNNTNRYFEYYFSKIPSILRRNRNSVAIITGKETETELEKLADDVFLYFGLGCRSVSMLYVPENYNFEPLIKAFSKYNHLLCHNKYANNFDYQYAINIVSRTPFINAKTILLKQEEKYNSPIAVLHYKFYKFAKEVYNEINLNINDIQCVAVNEPKYMFEVKFGTTQLPKLSDYADNIDTLEFITKL